MFKTISAAVQLSLLLTTSLTCIQAMESRPSGTKRLPNGEPTGETRPTKVPRLNNSPQGGEFVVSSWKDCFIEDKPISQQAVKDIYNKAQKDIPGAREEFLTIFANQYVD